MAITLSRSRVAPIMVKQEGTYASDPTPAGGTDDLLSYDSPIPHETNLTFVDLRPHSTSATWTTGIPAQRFGTVNFKTMFAGSGSAGTIAVNGFQALASSLAACGAVVEVATGTPTKLRIRPSTMAEWQGDSVTIYTDHNGQFHEINGAYGNCVMTGSPRTALECQFNFTGKWNTPTALSTEFASWSGGTNRAQAFLNVGATITPSGGSAYTGVIESYRFDFGNTITPIDDANDATGTWGILNVDKAPIVTLTIAQDNTGTNLTYANIYAHLTASTTHALSFTYGSGTGKAANWVFPALQLRSVRPADNAGHRAIALEYRPTGSTADSEWYCYIS